MEAKQAGGGGETASTAPTPAVAARTVAAQTSVRSSSPVPLKEEPKKDDDGFQTVPVRGTKESWRARRGRA